MITGFARDVDSSSSAASNGRYSKGDAVPWCVALLLFPLTVSLSLSVKSQV